MTNKKISMQVTDPTWEAITSAAISLNEEIKAKEIVLTEKKLEQGYIHIISAGNGKKMFRKASGRYNHEAGSKYPIIEAVEAVIGRFGKEKEIYILIKDWLNSEPVYRAVHVRKSRGANAWSEVKRTEGVPPLCPVCREMEEQGLTHTHQ